MSEYENVYAFFVEHWWYGVVFHLACYMPMWLTKMGRWSEWWDGR